MASPIGTAGLIYPVRFTTTGTVPVSAPQIKVGITYFIRAITATTVKVYSNSVDAAHDRNSFVLATVGTGTNNIVVLNTWSFGVPSFKNYPVYDFNGGYDTLTFTPSATSGAAVTLTASGAIFTSAMVGGAFIGGGGVGRITAFTDSTHVTIAVQTPFDNTSAISGRLSLLAEPAWSNLRGWPQKCSSYQNRSVFTTTDSLPNGFWASAINDYNDFNDLQTDDDDAISWFPTSDEINFIRFIVPYRSITVHTNSGVYSNPLSFETAITPKNFSLQLQDSTPADALQPRAIDNQIIVVSGNDVHSLLWDGLNNAYTSDIVSVMSEQLIRNPVDEAPYVDLRRAGSRYVFIINENGTMAIYQTLITQAISGWTPALLRQSYGDSYFRQVASNFNGRAWFVTERHLAVAIAPQNISGLYNGGAGLAVLGNSLSQTEGTAIKFTTSGTLPSGSQPITTLDWYWAVAVFTGGPTSNDIIVYETKEDADAGVNPITFTSAGTSSHVVAYPPTKEFMLEELSFDVFVDCATVYSGTPTSTITGLGRFDAQTVKMVGDGFGFEAIGNHSAVQFSAHGQSVEVSEAVVGFPIRYEVEPLPLTISLGSSVKQTTLTRPSHIRNVNFMFNNTIGGTINGVPIAIKTFDQAGIGEPPVPASGVFQMAVMKGWDDFNNPTFTIVHDEPFNIELLGIFYDVDV
jgi:hypothetical protein